MCFVPRDNVEAHRSSFGSAGSYEITSLTVGTQYNIRVEGSLGGGTAVAISTQTIATSKFSFMIIRFKIVQMRLLKVKPKHSFLRTRSAYSSNDTRCGCY